MKTNKIIAGLLVMLGFAACKPEDEQLPRCPGENEARYMYGVFPCEYETKSAVPEWREPSEDSVLFLDEIRQEEGE